MKKIRNITIIVIILTMCMQMILPSMVMAAETTLNVTIQRDENEDKINIHAIDTAYNIVEMKYINDYISVDNVNVFIDGDSRVRTIAITPAREIQTSFAFTNAGTYTVFTRNSQGAISLNRITIRNATEAPKLEITRSEQEPMKLNIKATGVNKNIVELKIAKKNDMNQTIDFSREGTAISIIPNAVVETTHTVSEEGIYAVYAKDADGYAIITNVIVTRAFPIQVTLTSNDAEKKIQIQATDSLFNITKIKILKDDGTVKIEDFATKGTEISFTSGKTVNTTYQVAEEGTYYLYFEDEYGYKKMSGVTVGGQSQTNKMTVDMTQDDANNKGRITIHATSQIYDIVEMKVAVGASLTLEDVKTNGQSIAITSGKDVTAYYNMLENGTLAVYVKDTRGNGYMMKKQITGITDVQDREGPEITLTQNTSNLKQIDVTVKDADYIRRIKYAEGNRDISYFQSNGTQIAQGSLGKEIRTEFPITKTGIYTVYAQDNTGNETVKTINITSIENPQPADTTPPTIKGVSANGLYNTDVTPIAEDENLASVVLMKNGTAVSGYQNGNKISEEGSYEIIARDMAGNETKVTFTIDKTAPKIETKKDTTVPGQVDLAVTVLDKKENITEVKVLEGRKVVGDFRNNGQQLNLSENGNNTQANIRITKNGDYTFYIKDKAGNEIVYVININEISEEPVDTTPPTITGVVDGRTYENEVIPVAHDTNLKEVTLKKDGVMMTGYKNGDAIQAVGTYILTAIDEAGNKTEITFTIIEKETPGENDTTAPVITGVVDGRTYEGSVTPLATDDNLNTVTLTKDGTVVSNYQNGRTITEVGSYTFIAIDKAGNKTEVSFTIKEKENPSEEEDTTPPVITGVENGKTYENPVTPVITDDNLNTVTLIKDGTILAGYQNGTQISTPGKYVLTAVDKAGNKTEVSFTIKEKDTPGQEDTTKPVITGVEDGKIYEGQVTPLATDENLDTVTLIKDGTTVSGYQNGRTITEAGSYRLIATDKAGNKTEVSFTIRQTENPGEEDTTPPAITGVEDGRIYENPVTPIVTDDNLNTVTLTKEGVIIAGYQNGTQISNPGKYILTAVDKAGNKTEVSFEIKEVENNDNNNGNNNGNGNNNNGNGNSGSGNNGNNGSNGSNNNPGNNVTNDYYTDVEPKTQDEDKLIDTKNIPKTGLDKSNQIIVFAIIILSLFATAIGVKKYQLNKEKK